MKIITLTLTNFKGIRDLTIDANGNNLSIYAENGVGKTTVADAAYWLLFGKDSLGRKDYEIKTIGESGEVIHFLDHTVEGVFQMDDGETLTLTRTYKEDWETQRGSSTKTHKGHTTSYTVNSVPQSATEYSNKISSICEEGPFRLLTDPSAFLNLSWQDRRNMLFNVCGNLSDADVIAMTPELADLGEMIGKHSVVDFRKIADSHRKAAEEERKQLPARIDEASRRIPAEDKNDWSSILAGRIKTLSSLMQEEAKIVAGGRAADLRSNIVDIQAKQRARISELRSIPDPAREIAIKARREQLSRQTDAVSNIHRLADSIARLQRETETQNAELDEKRKFVTALKAQVYNGANECPSCNQPLQEEKVQAAVEEFNSAKAKKLATLVEQGIALKASRDTNAASLASLQAEHAEAKQSIEVLKAEGIISIPDEVPIDPLTDPEYVILSGELMVVQQELDALSESSQGEIAKIEQSISVARSEVTEAQAAVLNTQKREEELQRVKTLKAREKELASQLEQLERSIYLCEQFTRAKVSLLTNRINDRFQLTTFRLFKDQLNGGLQECCDVLWRENGAQPSHGQSIQIGLDIIQTLSGHLNFSPCIFIDNSESLTHFPYTTGQQIRLVVSPGDKVLRVGSAPLDLGLSLADQEPALF